MGADKSTPTRRSVIIVTSLVASGCIDSVRDVQDSDADESDTGESSTETGPNSTGDIEQMGDLTLTSPAFDDGERIPEKYGYTEANVNPPLNIENVPDGAESLALIMDDPDAVEPAGKVWDHWVVWNIPSETTEIPEEWSPQQAMEGTNDYGSVGYGGPNPPDREHRYRFQLFALETSLNLGPETDADALRGAMDAHVLEQTQLDGTYPK